MPPRSSPAGTANDSPARKCRENLEKRNESREGRHAFRLKGLRLSNRYISIASILGLLPLSAYSAAQINSGVMSPPANTRPPRLENVGIEQHLDAQVPPGLTFRDDTGATVKLGDYFGHKPLILNLVYYNCTMLCGEALAGLASAMRS